MTATCTPYTIQNFIKIEKIPTTNKQPEVTKVQAVIVAGRDFAIAITDGWVGDGLLRFTRIDPSTWSNSSNLFLANNMMPEIPVNPQKEEKDCSFLGLPALCPLWSILLTYM